MQGRDHPSDTFRYDPQEVAAIQESFTLEPIAPVTIEDRSQTGRLVTVDVPAILNRAIAPQADTSIIYYRLTQLFGTPNVPGLRAGEPQRDRDRTTWQYLLEVTEDDPDETAPRQFLLSVYDFETNLSVGVSYWEDDTDNPGVDEPIPTVPVDVEFPPEPTLERTVQLVLASVEHAVPATYGEYHV